MTKQEVIEKVKELGKLNTAFPRGLDAARYYQLGWDAAVQHLLDLLDKMEEE